MTAELLRLHPPAAARRLIPLFTKTGLSLCEPVAYKGGSLLAIAKKAGAACACADFRSILVETAPAKLYHKCLRTRLIPFLANACQELQAGAVPGAGIESLSLVARTFQALSSARGRPWSLVFYDIKSAFYRVVRQLVLAVPDSDDNLRQVVATLGLPPRALQELARQLSSLEALTRAHVPDHVAALLTDVMEGTFFRIDGHDLIHLTKRGTRPGDPCADVLFAFLLSAYFDAVDRQLAEQGLEEVLPPVRTQPLTLMPQPSKVLGFASWADDCLRCASATSLEQVLEKTVAILQVSMEVAASLGIELSFGASKTCVLLSEQRDPAARLASDDPAGQAPDQLSVLNRLTNEAVSVSVVAAYKHLGCVVTSNMMPTAEIDYRFGQARSVSRPLAYRFFSSPAYPLAVRRYLLKSLALSRFVHGSVALTLHVGLHRRKWHNHYLSLWRTLLRRSKLSQKLPHAYETLRAARAPAPPLAQAYARATFLQRHILKGPAVLMHLLQLHWEMDPARSWLAQLQRDLETVCLYLPTVRPFLQEGCSVRAILASLQEQPGWWVKCVRQAQAAFQAYLDVWFKQASAPTQPVDLQPAFGGFKCPHCSAQFGLRRYLASHMAKKHGLLSPCRHFADRPSCIACLRHYTSVQAVHTHLRHTTACLKRAARLMPPLDVRKILVAEREEVERRKDLHRGRWERTQRRQSVLQGFGPRQPVFEERFSDEESVTLDELRRLFRPDDATLSWIDDYLAQASIIGPQTTSADFWSLRPSDSGQRRTTTSELPNVFHSHA